MLFAIQRFTADRKKKKFHHSSKQSVIDLHCSGLSREVLHVAVPNSSDYISDNAGDRGDPDTDTVSDESPVAR